MKPMKKGGWAQSIYQTSSTEKEMVGTYRCDLWGNAYHYAKAGAANLAAGKLTAAAAQDTDFENESVASATPVGSLTVDITVTSTTVAENYFRGGTLQVNDAAGEGFTYPILYSTAITAGTALTVTLDEPIRKALTTSSEVNVMHSPWMATIISPTGQAVLPVGIPKVDVTATYYYWSQTKGDACCLMNEAAASGAALVIGSSVAGSVEALDLVGETVVGTAREAGTDTEYYPIYLQID